MRRASMHAGYRVPGRVPEVWLTLMPPVPLGTTTMLAARMSGSQATRNALWAVVQIRRGLAGWFSATPPSEALVGDPGSGAIRVRVWRWYWTTLYRLFSAMAAAHPSRPQPVINNRYFTNNISFALAFRFHSLPVLCAGRRSILQIGRSGGRSIVTTRHRPLIVPPIDRPPDLLIPSLLFRLRPRRLLVRRRGVSRSYCSSSVVATAAAEATCVSVFVLVAMTTVFVLVLNRLAVSSSRSLRTETLSPTCTRA